LNPASLRAVLAATPLFLLCVSPFPSLAEDAAQAASANPSVPSAAEATDASDVRPEAPQPVSAEAVEPPGPNPDPSAISEPPADPTTEPPGYATTPAIPAGAPFDFAAVMRAAAELSRQPFARDRADLPQPLADLDYDRFRDIRFRRERAIWSDTPLPFWVELFSRGFLFKDRVRINLIEQGVVTPIDYSTELFDFGTNPVADNIPPETGFAGLRILGPINADTRFDEIAVFLGASYFRAVGQQQNYGITARGLAIDTGLATREEFPVFREFWVERPAGASADTLHVYALLDSERVTGAYRFRIQPGLHTVIDVKARLYFRDTVEKLGIAPLTSMFMHGKSTDRFMDDFRPEVHDSDGLAIETGQGERIWRPLNNPRTLRISAFSTENPRGFGLLQRERAFTAYEDLEAHYQRRPSLWVEPQGQWGKGVIELVEIPSQAERYDNIVAFWTPQQRPSRGDELEFAYRLRFALDPEARLRGARAVATRIGGAGTDELDSSRRKFVIEFVGPSLRSVGPEAAVDALVSSSSGSITPPIVQFNPETGGRRVFFELQPSGDGPVDLRCFLRHGNDVLSETWVFQWTKS
jgi:periplasmic glucans biosynthesis protein